MRSKLVAGLVAALVILLLFATAGTAKNESSCVTCHTDEAALKRLCKVPDLHAEEGG